MEESRFILACENCGQRIILENTLEFSELSKKFNIMVNDNKEILIMCVKCNNRIKI